MNYGQIIATRILVARDLGYKNVKYTTEATEYLAGADWPEGMVPDITIYGKKLALFFTEQNKTEEATRAAFKYRQ